MWARFALAFGMVLILRAQDDPRDLLRRVQTRVLDSLSLAPRYTCTQTIDRFQFVRDVHRGAEACEEGPERTSLRLSTSDRLRFDVAVSSTDEMYAWAGESRFDNRDLVDIVDDGAISTGSFAAFLTAIFSGEEANFTYNGEKTEAGRTLSEYGFRVPFEKSRYFFRAGAGRVVTAYDGIFLVDPRTAEMVRLAVRTSQLPGETGACFSTTTLDYARVNLTATNLLLPSLSVMRTSSRDGSIAENRAVFSNCHEFLGESTINFGPPSKAAAASETTLLSTLPPGLPFEVAFTQGIDTATAAAGDRVAARLVTPIRTRSKVLVAAGAAISARLVRIKLFHGKSSSVFLLVKLETVETGGGVVRLAAAHEPVRRFQQPGSKALSQRVELGTLRGLEAESVSFEFKNVDLPYLIASGLKSKWVTTAAIRATNTIVP